MKRLVAIILVLVTLFALSACSDTNQDSTNILPDTSTILTEQQTAQTVETDESALENTIGFSLAGDDSFSQQIKSDFEAKCLELGYSALIETASSAEEQITQIRAMVSQSVDVIIIEPVNVDELESVLAECDSQDIPVIDVVESINGLVSTLIAPDYLAIGKSAGNDAVELFGDGGQCLLIKTSYDSFPMQLMTDGFMEEISKDKDVTLYGEEYCGNDEELAYEAARMAILGGEVDFIFAQSAALAKGALRAANDFASEIKIVAFSGDMELISAAVEGKIYSCIFFGPKDLTDKIVYVADRFMKNAAYVPDQYIELSIEAAQGDGAAQYYVEGELYAEIKGE